MKISILTLSVALGATAVASPLDLDKRQCSKTFRYQYDGYASPGNYKAFNLGDCSAQLSLTKDQYISVIWAFEATYADGSVMQHKPFRNFDSFGTSDTLYPYMGNNFVTRYPGNSSFTAVHEFTDVCKGNAPVSWRFFTTSPSCFTSDQIPVVKGVSRPGLVSGVSMRRTSNEGDFTVTWTAVPGAVAYSVIVEYPTGRDEIGRPYLNVRGARVTASNLNPP